MNEADFASVSLPSSSGEAHRRASRVEYILLVILLLLSAIAYFTQVNPAIRQTDPAAYYYAGLRIAETGRPTFCDQKNVTVGPYFTMLGFKHRLAEDDPCFYSIFPPGFPLLIALAQLITPGAEVAAYLMPLFGLIGLAALFALGRELFDQATGILAIGFLTLNFTYWRMSTEVWSDVPATACLLSGALFAARMVKRDTMMDGLLSGAAFGYACLIRYTSAVALIPLVPYLWLAAKGQSKPWRAYAGFGLGFGALCLGILALNTLYYGAFYHSGYSTEALPWPRFSWSYALGQSPLGLSGFPAIWATLTESFHVGLAVAAISIAFMPRVKAMLVAGWILVFAILYSLYVGLPSGINARYLLPIFAMLSLAMAFGVIHLLRLLPRWRETVLLFLLPLILLAWHGPSIGASLLVLERQNRRIERQVAAVGKFTGGTEPEAVFLSREYHDLIVLYGGRSVLHYSLLVPLDPISRVYALSEYEPRLVQVVRELLESDIPVYVVLEPEERTFVQGPIEPYPILSAHFEMAPVRTQREPIVYRVLLPAADVIRDKMELGMPG